MIGRGGRTAKALRTVIGALGRPRRPRRLPRRRRALAAGTVAVMEVVVARIGRPHGIRGEVTVEVRTDDPERRLAPGADAAHRPGRRPARSPSPTGRVHSRPAAAALRGRTRPRAPPRRCATCCSSPTSTPTSGPRTRTSSTTTSWSACAVRHRRRRARSARSPRSLHLPGQDLLAVARGRTAPRCWCRSSRRSCPRSTSPAARCVVDPPPGLLDRRTATPTSRRADVRIDVVTIFPDYLAPAAALAARQGASRDGLLDLRVHDLRDWTTDRHRTVDDTPYGGGPGMVMRPEPWGDALDARRSATAGAAAAAAASCRRPAGAPFTQAMAARAGRPSRGWSSPAAATRASTSGCSTTPRPGCRSTRSRIGDYVLAGGEVAVLVDRRGGRPAAARRARQRRVAGRGVARRATGLLEAPSTPSRPTWRGRDVPECCSPATTRGSPAGAGTRRCAAPRPAGRTCSTALDPAALDRARPGRARRAGLGAAAADGRLARVAGACGRLSRCCRAGARPRHREGATARPGARRTTPPTHRG